jgi:glycosyltransferase involved in cell wall biosynthesis
MSRTTDIPQLSVVLPIYNASRFLRAALDSVLEQDFREFECIAIDDGSTDESPAILEEYQARDRRVRALHQGNVGLVDTLNRGIALSRAPLIARIDADDVCLPGRFTTQMQHFRGRNDLGVLGGQIQLIDENGLPLRLVTYPAGGKELETFLHRGSPVAHPAVMLRKAAVERVGLYRRAFKHAEDYDLWLRVHEAGYAIENVNAPVIEYRQHSENVSVVHRRQQAIATLAAQGAHRARMAGLSDPTADLDSLDERVFALFPAELMTDLRDQLFSLRMDTNAFETERQLVEALAAFDRLPADLQRTRNGIRFLMQVGRGALKLRLYSLAVASVTRAFATAPTEVVSIMARRAARLLRGSLAGAGLRRRRNQVSQRGSVE